MQVEFFPAEQLQVFVWLLAMASSAIGAIGAGYSYFAVRGGKNRWLQPAIGCGVLFVGILVASDLLGHLPSLADGWNLLIRAMVLGAIVLAVATAIGLVRLAGRTNERRSLVLFVLAILATAGSSARFYSVSAPPVDDLSEFDTISPEQFLVAAPNHVARTDLGREVGLFAYENPQNVDTRPKRAELVPDQFRDSLIVASANDPQTNCHGWVFTNGKFVVRGASIDQILSDNGYQPVTDPKAGDLIVHRDHAGAPLHTGVVKATGDKGFVLIESKWGFLGRYMHEPAKQCYSQNFAYYRSSRPNHLLRIEGQETPAGPGSTPTRAVPSQLVRTKPGDKTANELGAE